ncbi:MAG TPA: HGGxSTG domain-containing protein [Bradyrhizobium sp.]|uniref:HGGxSTG domain-containing protein n=1 Tax=Bradyrhizobium sp. TaxID=376 RepID=UPI002D05A2A5|nr:HGGxSTG domain-containing protein [Bradyrhizobium sp.]HTB04916.1 HGGxSTG domain-containing protein [Bradyrhizobium sp.]
MPDSQRCGAKTRKGGSCRSPTVHGKRRRRMHGGAAGSGAPKENENALKDGLFTKEAIEARKHLRELLQQSRRLLQKIQ